MYSSVQICTIRSLLVDTRECVGMRLCHSTADMATQGKIPTLSQDRSTDRDQKHKGRENKFTLG